MTPKLTWNRTSFLVDGAPAPLISGEFPYFRVPKAQWRERLMLLKASGANAVATYIPWIIHEPEEGKILFDDIPERSLTDFLSLCQELELMTIVRPGPYVYSELCNDGLPFWMEKYPQLRARGPRGEYCHECFDASYLHPLFLEKARKFIREANRIIRPFLVTNGGCVVSVQADNEISGIHIWRGFLDCNKEAMGFGRDDGYYVCFLKEKYGEIAALNGHYGTRYTSFRQVDPFHNTPQDDTVEGKRFACDYLNFYKSTLEIYMQTLCAWFAEDGIDVPCCANVGSAPMLPLLRDIPAQSQQPDFLLGVDHYYALTPRMGMSMTPEKTVKFQLSLDMLENMGMPPSVLELQSGSASAYPPILPENLYNFYMTHFALGMKGANYYIFSGGPNFENTGANVQVYDYHAPVSATGQVRPVYYAQKQYNAFVRDTAWLLTAKKVYDVQLGYYWEQTQESMGSPCKRYSRDGLNLYAYRESLLLAMGLSGKLVKNVEIGGDLDIDRPLMVICDQRMPKQKQEKLVEFVKSGGRLILTPVVPEYDEDFYPCTVLKDFLGVEASVPVSDLGAAVMENGERVYELGKRFAFPGFEGKVLCRNEADGKAVVEYKALGGGVVLLGAEFAYSQFEQMDMLDVCLQILNYRPVVQTGSRNLMATVWETEERGMCFLINNLAGSITATVQVNLAQRCYTLENVEVPPLSVVPLEL